jgi:hypothetical protein
MELWDYVFQADQRLDLSGPDAGRDWLASRPWGVRATAQWWTERAASLWTYNVMALRSLAECWRGKRLERPSEMDALTAENQVLRRYIGMFRVSLDRVQPRKEARHPRDLALSPTNCRGVVVLPSVPRADPRASGERKAEAPHPPMFWVEDCEFFWQCVFLSLLTGISSAFCESCGQALGAKTATGRPKRQRLCGRCRWKAWWAKRPQKEKRAKWRLDNDRRRKG